jgi:hypothetical protein
VAETIQAIEEVFNIEEGRWSQYDGFKITTSEQEILLLISNDQSCCESWGYFLSEDDFDKFIGAELREVSITDTNLTSRQVGRDVPYEGDNISVDEGDVMFVNLNTNKGVLQFVAYNAHNGYYGHTARVVSKQLQHETSL